MIKYLDCRRDTGRVQRRKNVKTGEKQIQKWLTRLQNDDWTGRWKAARKLRGFQNSRCIPALLHALHDRNWVVRWEAAETLAQIGDATIIQPLLVMLSGEITYLRAPAAWILGKKRVAHAVLPLIQALEDPNWFGRAKAAWALGEIGDWRAVTPLMTACHDLEPGVCDAAEIALKHIYSSVTTVFFGNPDILYQDDRRRVWLNPDVRQFQVPLVTLKRIVIHAATHDFYGVECFLTYAINSIKPAYLKTSVSVDIYGDPARIHSNLLNNFTYLCKQVTIHSDTRQKNSN